IFYGVLRFHLLIGFVLGRTKTMLGATLVGGGLNLALNLVLVPLFRDITVPAATTLLAYGVSCGYAIYKLRPLWRVQVAWGLVLRYVVAAVAMGAVLWLLGFRPATPTSVGVLPLLGAIVAGALVYFASLATLGGLDWRELNGLIKQLRAPP